MQVTKGTWRMCEQCVPGSLSSSPAREPGNEASQAPEPENLQQLRSYFGLLNYYGRFIPNLATVAHPLNKLLRDDVQMGLEC